MSRGFSLCQALNLCSGICWNLSLNVRFKIKATEGFTLNFSNLISHITSVSCFEEFQQELHIKFTHPFLSMFPKKNCSSKKFCHSPRRCAEA